MATGAVLVTLASTINRATDRRLDVGSGGFDQAFTTGPNETGKYGYVLTKLEIQVDS